ncbi:MAG: OmpA family protein [Alphaproteobacteria bacterium]|nr:OmpA family protein [Alphaproteobacteria bacterium]MCB9791291.1 OmpA family protein [Alphaproteobacteria bacterium]
MRIPPWTLLLLAAGCVSLDALPRDLAEAQRIYEEAGALNAKECTPREYAMAESHLDFARLEFEQGDPARARQHLDVSLQNGTIALNTAPSCLPKDRDGDGINDDVDDCPDEPEDFDGVADEDGCPDIVYDTDGDGLLDDVDGCPEEPEDLDSFKDADGCPDYDNDQDGIGDVDDGCPITPEDKDGFQDEDGCPDDDNDNDGLFDKQDQCPNVAGPAPTGCPPQDADGDGFMDDVDRCPTVPGVAPDGCPPQDSDGDGFVDPVDACPMEPGVAPDGCPIRDADGDGLLDNVDQCPQQPETFNEYLDQDGCPDTKPQKVKIANKQIVIEEQIQFETGKAIIRPESYGILDSVVQVMKDYPQIEVRIEGHTDSDGSEEMNQKLSKARADAVFEYLLEKGIQGKRLETVGYGETKPIDTNRTPEGKKNNRRVEFHITKGLDE